MIHALGGNSMFESILVSMKKLLGPDVNYGAFDIDLIMHINSVFVVLKQLGAGPDFSITGEFETWSDYLGTRKNLELIKTYMYCKVRKIFDPPTSSTVMQAFDSMIQELEWRINVETDNKEVSIV